MIYSCCRLWLHERGEIAPDICPACGKTPQLAEVIASAELTALQNEAAELARVVVILDDIQPGDVRPAWERVSDIGAKLQSSWRAARKSAFTEAAHRFAHAAAVLGVPGVSVQLSAVLAELERME